MEILNSGIKFLTLLRGDFMLKVMSENFFMGVCPIEHGGYTIVTVIHVDMSGFALNGGFIFFADFVPHTFVILYGENLLEAYSFKI